MFLPSDTDVTRSLCSIRIHFYDEILQVNDEIHEKVCDMIQIIRFSFSNFAKILKKAYNLSKLQLYVFNEI